MVTDRKAGDHEEDVLANIEDPTREVLAIVLYSMPFIGYAWLYYCGSQRWPIFWNVLVTIILWFGAFILHWLRPKSLRWASWFLIVMLICCEAVVVMEHPGVLAMSFGVLAVILGCNLLGSASGAVVVLAQWVTAAAGFSIGTGARAVLPDTLGILLLYTVVWATASVGNLPRRRWLDSALAGWAQARRALLEARQRRAELHGIARALEDASYRLQRANNELLVAQSVASRLQQAKDSFVATLSHELRGSLNLILGFSKLVALSPEKYGGPLPSAYRVDIEAIYRNCEHLTSLVDDILDLSQIEADRLPLIRELVDVEQDVIREAREAVERLAERKGLYLRCASRGECRRLLADKVRLRQVMLNLLTNAVRFTERGGITISSEWQDNQLVVSVQDTGSGIPSEKLPQLFRAFSQLHRTETREASGSGLGLSICKELVQLHGGQIWATGREGIGTTISFSIPYDAQSAVRPMIRTDDGRLTTTAARTLLVVDDDPSISRLLRRYLSGYSVLGVTTQPEAFGLATMVLPDAIVAPPASVDALLSRLKDLPFDIPIISCALSKMASGPHFDSVAAIITKPVAAETIARVVAHLSLAPDSTILLVDDDPDAVRLLEAQLASKADGFRVLKAYNGEQALDIMRDVVPSLVAMDLVMPGIDGEETIKRMSASDRLRHVPVVVVSGEVAKESEAVVHSPISVHLRETMSLGQYVECLQLLLDVLVVRRARVPTLS